MRQSSALARRMSNTDRTSVAERLIAFLRERYPSKTAENVAVDIGCAPETIAKMMERVTTPNAVTFGRMIIAYGPAFLVAVFPCRPAWLDDAYQREQLAELEAEQARIQSKINALRGNS